MQTPSRLDRCTPEMWAWEGMGHFESGPPKLLVSLCFPLKPTAKRVPSRHRFAGSMVSGDVCWWHLVDGDTDTLLCETHQFPSTDEKGSLNLRARIKSESDPMAWLDEPLAKAPQSRARLQSLLALPSV